MEEFEANRARMAESQAADGASEAAPDVVEQVKQKITDLITGNCPELLLCNNPSELGISSIAIGINIQFQHFSRTTRRRGAHVHALR